MSIKTMSDGTEIDPEAVDDTLIRALKEPMLVYKDHPDVRHDHGAVVYSEAREYRVNVDFCSCPAFHFYHDEGEDCKHMKRYKLATGELVVPDWVQFDAIDRSLQLRLEEMEGDDD